MKKMGKRKKEKITSWINKNRQFKKVVECKYTETLLPRHDEEWC